MAACDQSSSVKLGRNAPRGRGFPYDPEVPGTSEAPNLPQIYVYLESLYTWEMPRLGVHSRVHPTLTAA